MGMNYVCHFLTVRKSIMDKLELPGKEYDGSQDWHMTFRIGEQSRYVHHEPRVLYHWRVHSQSTAARADPEGLYARQQPSFRRNAFGAMRHQRAQVVDSTTSWPAFSSLKVDYSLGDHPLVSIIIPNKDAVPVLHNCLSSIRKFTTYDNYEIVIVENKQRGPAPSPSEYAVRMANKQD
ncbi:MAG: glycosyltransferase family 2 protein [Bifidobacterium pseudocatenulatum]